jgi:short-subunit dehydrogenase
MRSIIVTGASSGIGAALARLCVERGWNVLAVARRAERLATLTGATTLALDVTARDAPARIVEAAVRAFGSIDVVVNNAGAAQPGLLLEQRDAAIEAQWQLHVAAPLRIARAALAHVRAAHGGFVFIGSGLARVPAPGYGAYASAKAAIRAAAIQLRRELRAEGVFVTYVDPGVVDTEFSTASGMQPDPAWWHATPKRVAARILNGISRRAARVNAVGWQTAGTVLGEWFPGLADAAMSSLVTPPATTDSTAVQDAATAAPIAADISQAPFETALVPVRRRMERVNLPEAFVRDLLIVDSEIVLHEAAMRWAGMPNKNERAALLDVLTALEVAGFLRRTDEERWSVVRSA